jgi:hypothetical protein
MSIPSRDWPDAFSCPTSLVIGQRAQVGVDQSGGYKHPRFVPES